MERTSFFRLSRCVQVLAPRFRRISCGRSKWRRVSCEQQLSNSNLVPDSVEEIRVFQACDSGWRCDIKCCALAHTRKCAFFPIVSIPCFCDQRERNLTGDVLPSASRQCSVRLQQSAHVFAFSLLSSSTVPVCWSCADSSTHLLWLKTSSWWKKTRCMVAELDPCPRYTQTC